MAKNDSRACSDDLFRTIPFCLQLSDTFNCKNKRTHGDQFSIISFRFSLLLLIAFYNVIRPNLCDQFENVKNFDTGAGDTLGSYLSILFELILL